MKFKRELLLTGAAIILGLALWLRPAAATNAPTHTKSPRKSETQDGRASDSLTVEHPVAKSATIGKPDPQDPATITRRRDLERLREKWLQLGPGNGNADERDALMGETIESLMCGPEMHELSEFLDKNGIEMGSFSCPLDDMAGRIFESSSSAKARELLLMTLKTDVPQKTLDRWCEAAGRGCEPGDFQAFLEKVAGISNDAARNVMFGQCKELSKTDPCTALGNLLESIAVDSLDESQRNTDKFRVGYLLEPFGALPPNTDFEALTQILDQYDPDGKRFGARDELFQSWAKSDPAEAANFIMAHPEKYPPELIEPVAKTASCDLESALQWVATFPRGAYRDAAAIGLADKFDLPTPENAARFLPFVDDPKSKTRLLEMIKGAEGTMANDDKY